MALPEEVLRFRAAMGHMGEPGEDPVPALWNMLPRSGGDQRVGGLDAGSGAFEPPMKSEVGECLPLANGGDPVTALIADVRERPLESRTPHQTGCSLNACFDLRDRDDAQVEGQETEPSEPR